MNTFDRQGQHFVLVSTALSGGEAVASSWVPYRGWALFVPNDSDPAGTSFSSYGDIPDNSLSVKNHSEVSPVSNAIASSEFPVLTFKRL